MMLSVSESTIGNLWFLFEWLFYTGTEIWNDIVRLPSEISSEQAASQDTEVWFQL